MGVAFPGERVRGRSVDRLSVFRDCRLMAERRPAPVGARPPSAATEATEAVGRWLVAVTRAMRAVRVYAENNETHQTLVGRAYDGLATLLDASGDVHLTVREDRLLHLGETALTDGDREHGLPSVLHRNGFRSLTFLVGFERHELVALLGALNCESGPLDLTGEDLSSSLWRLKLPHLRYVTIDGLGLDGSRAPDKERHDQIQADIESIVAAVYRTSAPDEDLVAGVRLAREDIEALVELRAVPADEFEDIERWTALAVAEVPVARLANEKAALAAEDRAGLALRALDILVKLLFLDASAASLAAPLGVMQQLFDGLLAARRFSDARALVERLHRMSAEGPDLRHVHLGQQLLRLLATEARLLPVLDALNDGYRTTGVSEISGFLQAFGRCVVPVLLEGLDRLDAAAHRRLVCELIAELGVPPMPALETRFRSARWFVARDLLELARHHPVDATARLVFEALEHEHPKVRAAAVRLLRDHEPGRADERLGDRLLDDDAEVRMVAARVAATRRARSLLARFEELVGSPDFAEREPRELRVLLGAYAWVGQGHAISLLGRILHPRLIDRLRGSELQAAAAAALGLIKSDKARRMLERGTRSLSGRVREACRRALASASRGPDLVELDGEGWADPGTGSGTYTAQPREVLPAALEVTPERALEVEPRLRTEAVLGRLPSAPEGPEAVRDAVHRCEPTPDESAVRPATGRKDLTADLFLDDPGGRS